MAPSATQAPAKTPHEIRAEQLKGLAPGRIVVYRDHNEVDHVALVVRVLDSVGQVNLIEFATNGGDEACALNPGVSFWPEPRHNHWRWPEHSRSTLD